MSKVHLNMLQPRRLMFGEIPGGQPEGDPFSYFDDPYAADEEDSVIAFDGEVVIPVIARPDVIRKRADGFVDGTAEVVVGDVTEAMSMTPFERTQADYNGIDRRGTPTVDFDEISNYTIS